ncbi:MAG TPA: NAD(P)/FAD-dependent oxidoreductase [Solirubrobacteraceae bacterium]|jgi:cation diffusion facilitator CzcD-associated flavoprotein CzcO|nr:NAD(P)/FAD-dependent oxidoreductase [Solirubrobacteraceae bacterium]
MGTVAEQAGSPAPTEVRRARIGILGAGFAGLGLAIRLKQAGIEDFVVLEREAEVGGTWWANTYPGCQCDIPSHLYSFSFALNPDWTRTYAKQGELRDYLHECSHRFGVREHLRLGCEVLSAVWDDGRALWRLETSAGPYEVEMMVAAPGPLSEPSLPSVPGLDSFSGEIWHTARWNHDYPLEGKRVVVVGTGASAIQAVPEIQPLVEKLTVLQRTAPWVMPHRDRPITRFERRLYRRFPGLQRAVRAGVYGLRELLVPGLVYQPRLLRGIERLARGHIAKQVPDPALRAKLTPDYTIGCKRILPSSRWYPALNQPNVEVVTSGLAEVTPDGIRTADGQFCEADVIIFATGFYVTDIPFAATVTGSDGRRLSEVWAGSPQAYRGTAIPGFPNMFLLVGPGTGLGHNSIVFMIEAQLHYLLDALSTMQARGARTVEVRPEAWERYNQRLQARMGQTVWNSGGCMSWYIDANGRNTTIWPDFTWRFWQQLRRFDSAAYRLSSAPSPAGQSVELAAHPV